MSQLVCDNKYKELCKQLTKIKNEKRVEIRVSVDITTSIRYVNGVKSNIKADIVNLSINGMGMILTESLGDNDCIEFTLHLGTLSIPVLARVAWITDLGGKYAVGCQSIAMKETYLTLIGEYLSAQVNIIYKDIKPMYM